MKTTIDIPDKELRDAMKFTVVKALEEFNRRQRMAALVKYTGTFDSLMTNEEIEALDENEPHHPSKWPDCSPTDGVVTALLPVG